MGALNKNGNYNHHPEIQNYRNINLNNHQMQTYNFGANWSRIAMSVFLENDRDGDGNINMMEFPAVMTSLFQKMNMPPPNFKDMFYLMQKFDTNGDGIIDCQEYINMVSAMAKGMNSQQQQGGGNFNQPQNNFGAPPNTNYGQPSYNNNNNYSNNQPQYGGNQPNVGNILLNGIQNNQRNNY